MNEKTTVALDMGKSDRRDAVTALIEHLMYYPIREDEHSQKEIIDYNMGMSVLFDCLRSTY